MLKDFFFLNLSDYENFKVSFPIGAFLIAVCIASCAAVFAMTHYKRTNNAICKQLMRHGAIGEEKAKTLKELRLLNSRAVKSALSKSGQITYIDGKYYWYGENKDMTTAAAPACPYWHNGVRCYSSDDLYNWKDEGFILEANDDINSPLCRRRVIDRPHIIYNKDLIKKEKGYMRNLYNDEEDFRSGLRCGICYLGGRMGTSYLCDADFVHNRIGYICFALRVCGKK